jgi:hypothetical protein
MALRISSELERLLPCHGDEPPAASAARRLGASGSAAPPVSCSASAPMTDDELDDCWVSLMGEDPVEALMAREAETTAADVEPRTAAEPPPPPPQPLPLLLLIEEHCSPGAPTSCDREAPQGCGAAAEAQSPRGPGAWTGDAFDAPSPESSWGSTELRGEVAAHGEGAAGDLPELGVEVHVARCAAHAAGGPVGGSSAEAAGAGCSGHAALPALKPQVGGEVGCAHCSVAGDVEALLRCAVWAALGWQGGEA